MARIPDYQLARKVAVRFGGAPPEMARLLARQNPTGQPTAIRALPGGALGTVGSARPADAGNVLVFAGVPILGPVTDHIVDIENAVRLLPEYEGAFVAVHWDDMAETLTVVTDCLGLQPAYFRHEGRSFTLVSDTRALNGEPDLAAWGAFFSLNHTIGQRTLMQGLTRLPPASILRFQPRTGVLYIDRYWDWPMPSDNWRAFDFADAMSAHVVAYTEYVRRGTLLLSGGLDSRLLLGLLTRAEVDTEALIVAHANELAGADGRYAAAAARAFGVPYRRITPSAEFLSSADYLSYIEAIDAGFGTLAQLGGFGFAEAPTN